MANEHAIFIHGKRLDPRDAAKLLLPSDTLLACPHCESRAVGSVDAKLTERLPEERGEWALLTVPRMQDRWCHDCGHRWATVLPPEFQACQAPLIIGG